MNWILLSFTEPLLELLNFPYLYYWIVKLWEKNKGKKSKLLQIEANRLFEPPTSFYPDKFAVTTTLMFYTSFFVIYCPIMIFFTLLSLFINYVVDKFVFFNYYKKPEMLSGLLPRRTYNLIISICPLLICVYLNRFPILFSQFITQKT